MTTVPEFRAAVLKGLSYLDTVLPAGSHVAFMPLVDGRVLWDHMHDRIHPIGVPYPAVYELLSCVGSNPCWGWLNSNEVRFLSGMMLLSLLLHFFHLCRRGEISPQSELPTSVQSTLKFKVSIHGRTSTHMFSHWTGTSCLLHMKLPVGMAGSSLSQLMAFIPVRLDTNCWRLRSGGTLATTLPGFRRKILSMVPSQLNLVTRAAIELPSSLPEPNVLAEIFPLPLCNACNVLNPTNNLTTQFLLLSMLARAAAAAASRSCCLRKLSCQFICRRRARCNIKSCIAV